MEQINNKTDGFSFIKLIVVLLYGIFAIQFISMFYVTNIGFEWLVERLWEHYWKLREVIWGLRLFMLHMGMFAEGEAIAWIGSIVSIAISKIISYKYKNNKISKLWRNLGIAAVYISIMIIILHLVLRILAGIYR